MSAAALDEACRESRAGALPLAQAKIEQRPQAEPLDRLAMAGLGRATAPAGSGRAQPGWRGAAPRRPRSRQNRRASTGTFSMRAAMIAPAIAANSRPPKRRSTSSGSSEMRGMQRQPAVDDLCLAGDHRRIGAGARSGPVGAAAAKQRGEDRRGRGRAADADDRRAPAGRRRRPPPPCRTPWSRRSRARRARRHR